MWELFRVAVTEVRAVTPHLAEIAFGGPALAGFDTGGYDQRSRCSCRGPASTSRRCRRAATPGMPATSRCPTTYGR